MRKETLTLPTSGRPRELDVYWFEDGEAEEEMERIEKLRKEWRRDLDNKYRKHGKGDAQPGEGVLAEKIPNSSRDGLVPVGKPPKQTVTRNGVTDELCSRQRASNEMPGLKPSLSPVEQGKVKMAYELVSGWYYEEEREEWREEMAQKFVPSTFGGLKFHQRFEWWKTLSILAHKLNPARGTLIRNHAEWLRERMLEEV
jgi:hypothetical protein